jgi:hypothetical protein
MSWESEYAGMFGGSGRSRPPTKPVKTKTKSTPVPLKRRAKLAAQAITKAASKLSLPKRKGK